MIKQKEVCIVHNISHTPNKRYHSITVNGVEGLRVSLREIARNGSFAATMKGYDKVSVLPRVFLITDFSSVCKTINTEEIK